MTAADVVTALAAVADPADAVNLQRFFKTGPGEYAEGDVFVGVRVPATRRVAKLYSDLSHDQVNVLLDSAVHEHRLAALIILNAQYAAASKPRTFDPAAQAAIVDLYLAAVRRGRVNNWDLADSEDLWERRVAVLTTFEFIKRGDETTTLQLCERLLADRADLIQKATGWMLREVGKRIGRDVLVDFLDRNAAAMGRTALSYAIEHLDPDTRQRLRSL